MKIKYGKQIDIQQLKDDIDLFIMAGNHEKRVFTAFKHIKEQVTINKVIMFCYKSFECPKEYHNVFTFTPASHNDVYNTVDSELESLDKKRVVVFVDYSCMTKSWYYSILLFLANKRMNFDEVVIYFSYTPSKFSPPQSPKPNIDIAPLPGKYVVPTDKPKALIVCLGYEQNKAEGIIDHLDPKISFIFYTKPALDDNFVQTIEENNRNILENNINTTIVFPFDDLLFLEREITSLYYLLKDDYSIIIAPLGPKPFTFVSMVLAVKFKEIDIWRVGSGSDINEYPRVPIEDTYIVSEMVWIN